MFHNSMYRALVPNRSPMSEVGRSATGAHC